jgi:hypothetical protein
MIQERRLATNSTWQCFISRYSHISRSAVTCARILHMDHRVMDYKLHSYWRTLQPASHWELSLFAYGEISFARSHAKDIHSPYWLSKFLLFFFFCSFFASRRQTSKSKSKSHYDRLSVGQFVLVPCPFWSRWPDVTFIWVTICLFFM